MSHNPNDQLVRVQSWCRQSAPAFYADQERYLGVLRERLPQAAHRALTELLCQVDRDRLDRLTDQERQSLQQRIDQLVLRCSTLLTIEQLQLLARRLDREKQSRRRHAQQAMVEALQRSTDDPSVAQGGEDSAAGDAADFNASLAAPSGSVELRFAPPIDQPSLLEGLIPSADPLEEDDFLEEDTPEDLESALEMEQPALSDAQASDRSLSAPDTGAGDLAMLRSLFVMAGEAMEASSSLDAESDGDSSDHGDESPQRSDDDFMPSMPLELLRWLDGLDAAIHRRLRNLSHAINVELLRAGVATSLLPMSLLDAVLNGQVETLPSASNLVRLRLPMPMTTPGDPLMDLICVLLRPSELEFDLVPLRRCRSRLRQRRHNLLTMVRQQRHWQRRAQTQQVQQQWWPSPPTSPPQS